MKYENGSFYIDDIWLSPGSVIDELTEIVCDLGTYQHVDFISGATRRAGSNEAGTLTSAQIKSAKAAAKRIRSADDYKNAVAAKSHESVRREAIMDASAQIRERGFGSLEEAVAHLLAKEADE